MTGYDVHSAIDSLIEFYIAEERNREPRNFNLSENSTEVYEEVKKICIFRLGKSNSKDNIKSDLPHPISIGEILICLKRIKKSITTWTKRKGSQGYLDLVKQYIPYV